MSKNSGTVANFGSETPFFPHGCS